MRLLSLEVENYRNIASASLTPGRELTVICGNNGQGKTNLLEAIWLLTGGKSFRGGKDAELVRRGEPFAVLKASTLRAQQEEQEKEEPNRVRLTVGAPDSPRPGRTVSVNGGAVKRAASLAGSFPAVVFDPGHLSLVKGAPEGRRKFLDAALCQLYPGYLTVYRRYIPFGESKRFGIFTDIQLLFGGSQGKFAADSPIKGTFQRGFDFELGLSPGLIAFATNSMAVEVNVGMMGIGYSRVRQVHNQVTTGTRHQSAMNFKVNLLSIGLGISFYL